MAKMDKNTIPENFTLSLALVDAIPVILFCINCILIGAKLQSTFFILGAVTCLVSGIIKVLWKIIVVIKKKNIWWMFQQMRIAMPIGFVVLIIAGISIKIKGEIAITLPIISIICFLMGILGFVLMGVFAIKLNPSEPKSNWIEQITNSVAQAVIFVGLLLI